MAEIVAVIETNRQKKMETLWRSLSIVGLLFIFLVGVNTLSASFNMAGAGFAKTLFDVTSHPITSFFAGMLATALIQSSSTSTSIIVGLCSSGAMSIGGAIPMIMGANLGTSITNSLVSLAHSKGNGAFRRAFSVGTVHDIFNILSVAILFPIEMYTGFMEKSATAISGYLYGASSNIKFASPLKAAIKPMTNGFKYFVTEVLGFQGALAGITLVIMSGIIIVLTLAAIVRVMKSFMEANRASIVEKLLSKNGHIAIAFGALVTVMVQSSSITTSLLVPMAGAGMLSLRSAFPVTVGANIGTTATAIIASFTGNMAGLAIALVHLIFNVLGMLIWYPFQSLRNVPVALAEKLGALACRNRLVGLAYVFLVFFLFPFLFVIF